jgi:hypothetical protein
MGGIVRFFVDRQKRVFEEIAVAFTLFWRKGDGKNDSNRPHFPPLSRRRVSAVVALMYSLKAILYTFRFCLL